MKLDRCIGIDVGGANLKAADGSGVARSTSFELWKAPERLAEELRSLIDRLSPEGVGAVALTMTGELADCFATKADGVRAIVGATVAAAGEAPVYVATVDDRWLTVNEAIASPALVAAANWRVAARLVARRRPRGRGLWVDVGSTTVDAIPVVDGAVASRGRTDTDRLLGGELVYTGARRTPVCAIVDRLPYRGESCPVAAELFATAADAWLLVGELSEDASDVATADGRPLTREASIARLARCVCADSASFTDADARVAADAAVAAQIGLLRSAIVRHAPDWIAISGEGEFLARRAVTGFGSGKTRWEGRIEPGDLDVELISFVELVGPAASRSLPAHAAAVLLRDEFGGAT